MTRTQEILQAVDHLIHVHDKWEADETAPDVPTEEFERAVLGASEVCDGDVPAQCREVVDAMSRLQFEWDRYSSGAMSADHRPIGAFWAAFRHLLHARKGAVPFVPRRPEPVKLLLEQGVTYRQIALCIYGDGATGPLVGADGQPDIGKITQEAEHPGSVVPADWVHPDDVARLRKFESDSERRLTSIQAREDSERYIDPSTVEDLLRGGQYPDIVAKVKGVPIEKVEEVAAKLRESGVAISERPNLAALRSPQEPAILPEADAALQPRMALESDPEREQRQEQPGEVEELILLVAEEHPEMGAGEIVAHLAGEHETSVTVQKVSAVLRKAKEAVPAG